MRILIVLPQQASATGNHITAGRQAQGLRNLGETVEVAAIDLDGVDALRQAVTSFRPDIVHLLHAWRTGKSWLALQGEFTLPYLVTLTGTDIHHDLATVERGPVCREVMRHAAAIVTQNPLTATALRQRFPAWFGRIRDLPQGIVLGDAPYPLRARHGIAAGTILFLHPAGIRPVKGNLELLELFAPVAAARPQALLALCGPELDASYADRLRTALANAPYARYLGTLPPTAMAAALRECDIVLNNSISEGLPQALLEATIVGVPLLASNIEGNRAAVIDGENGFLYGDAAQFREAALRLIDSPALRHRLGHPRPELYHPAIEAHALHALLHEIAPHPIRSD